MMDFHCHLDLYKNSIQMLPVVAKRNIFTLVVTTSPRAWQLTSQLFVGYKNIQTAVGLHPEVVEYKYKERSLLLEAIPKVRFVGEIGIDGSEKYKQTFSLQESIFTDTIITCQETGGKILSIHSRNAATRVLSILRKYNNNCIPILHWFSGTMEELEQANELGCWFSVNPTMINSARGRSIIKKIPIDKLIPESDGPFTNFGSNVIMPWEAIRISDKLCDLWEISKEHVFEQLQANQKKLLEQDIND
ncbi:MAG: TatD DNase family protein [Fusobacteria bacterium]|nr:MAG: TatD DNase family protein [Fusobacteriota bacterium]KAF0228604.1 MAG: TatD DNase family [Fusobacteriota bacterium]